MTKADKNNVIVCIKPRNKRNQKSNLAAHYYANEMTFDLKICIFTNVVPYVIIPYYGTKIGSKMTFFLWLIPTF